jgi:hypothetical protein
MKNFAKLIAAAALATVWLPAPAESTKRVDKRHVDKTVDGKVTAKKRAAGR